jgi:hypothetical protein
MPSLDDSRWSALAGDYRTLYDVRPLLKRLASNWQDDAAWTELWQELHHQADVGDASYAAVPVLVELGRCVPARGWNFYGLLATIETERHASDNPPMPEWLVSEYLTAWEQLLPLALEELQATSDPYVVQTALAVVALAKGDRRLGTLLSGLDTSELVEILDEQIAWSERYEPARPPELGSRPSS